MTPDQNQSLMLITKMLENNTQEIRGLQEDVSKIIEKIHEVKIEVRLRPRSVFTITLAKRIILLNPLILNVVLPMGLSS